MKRFVSKPSLIETNTPVAVLGADGGAPVDFDVEVLLDKTGLVLQREVQNLVIASAKGKLSPELARDLVNYTTLLHKLREEQRKAAASMTDEELSK